MTSSNDPDGIGYQLPTVEATVRMFVDKRARRADEMIDTGIVHSMGEKILDRNGDAGPAGKIYPAWEWLELLDLSVHALFPPTGGVIVCAETDGDVCWHARGWNKRSIGAEFLVAGVHHMETHRRAIGVDPKLSPFDANLLALEPAPASPFTEEQYQAGGWYWARASMLAPSFGRHIIAHSAASPARKVDPGPLFDWVRFWFWFDRFLAHGDFGLDL